jgi:hypothetical protein
MANNSNSRSVSSQPGQGGNWPSTTGNKSGGDRGNAAPAPKGGKK